MVLVWGDGKVERNISEKLASIQVKKNPRACKVWDSIRVTGSLGHGSKLEP